MKTTSLVVKVASRCNLNCTYCYVYNMGDFSYKMQPKFMSNEIIEELFKKIKKLCKKNDESRFLIIFHGGEPLLTGIEFYRNFVEVGKNILKNDVSIDYALQTNGVLLDENWCIELKNLNIQVGVSLDGTPDSNNKNRIYHNNKGSYNDIIKGFKILKKIQGDEFTNCLCVTDTNEKPSDVYTHFKRLKVNTVHFLFQDFNYKSSNQTEVPKVGDWLIEMFNLWYFDMDRNKPKIRPLIDLMGLIFSLNKNSEIFGKGKNDTLVIETNGDIETVDTLKICGDGFTKTTLNIVKDDIDSIYEQSSLAKLYYNAHDELCATCLKCELESVCGGGYLGHRYSPENGFDNPSIYCLEIGKIICHIQNKILDTISIIDKENSGIEYLNFDNFKNNLHIK